MLSYIIKRIVKLIEIQLMLTSLSWPIVIYWGFSISPLSIISTVIGTPIVFGIVINGFLCLITDFLYIENKYLYKFLDFLAEAWNKFFSIDPEVKVIVAPCISKYFLIICFIFYFFCYRKIKCLPQKIVFSLIYIISLYYISHSLCLLPDSIDIKGARIKSYKKFLVLYIDKIPNNIYAWHRYELLANLRKIYGRSNIDKIKIKKKKNNLEWLKEIQGINFCNNIEIIE